MRQQIAKIENAFLGFAYQGVLTATIRVHYGGGSVGNLGGFVMSTEDHPDKAPRATPRAMDFIIQVLRAVGVSDWAALKGRHIYCLFADGDSVDKGDRPIGIENLPTEKGERFLFADWQAQVREASWR